MRVFSNTRRYLGRCPGIGARAFRHLVASALLKASGNDGSTAAMLLNDPMPTVEKYYGRVTHWGRGREDGRGAEGVS